MRTVAALPTVHVLANESPLPAAALLALSEIRVQQRLSLPALGELTFSDPPGPWPAVEWLAPGTRLRVQVADRPVPLFVGEVTALEFVYGPAQEREMRVRAYDLLHRLRKRQQVRAHVQVNALELARELAQDLGVQVHGAAAGAVWTRLYQHQQNDLELLTQVAERCGLYLNLWADTLHLLTLDGLGPPLPLALGEELLEAHAELNGDPACRQVRAAGWDPLRVETHRSVARRARVGRQVAGDVPPGAVGGGGEWLLVDTPTADDAQAAALAQAELDRQVGREVTLWGVAEGDPRLRPGAQVMVSGLAAPVAGRYVLTSTTHLLNAQSGYVTELETVPPPPRPAPAGVTVTLGVVTQINDPQGAGRVKVALPAYEDLETDWLAVLAAGAGPGKGLVAIPDNGDRVLVMLLQGDPGRGVVLGGLYGMAGPPDSGVEGGAVARYTFLTPGGQRVRLDDTAQMIRLENSRGSFVELRPDTVHLFAATDLTIEAPGRRIILRSNAIDFERG